MQSHSIIVSLITINLSAFIDTHQSCLTWEKEQTYLRFLCRVTDDSNPVILIDSDGETYEGHIVNDQLYNIMTHESHVYLANIHDIIFTIDTSQKTNVDGIWMCCQGEETFQTEVSVTAGIISATSIQLVGTLINNYYSSKVKLACFSCREPYGNNVEFLINEQSEDTITFNKDTGTCIHIKGNCLPNECVCSSSGNEFIRIFPINSYEQSTLYSCSMRFTDKDKGSVFLKMASVYFNGTEFVNMTTTTTIIKAPDVNEGQTKSDFTGNYPARFLDVHDTMDEDSEQSSKEVINIGIMLCGFTIICILAVHYFFTSEKYEKNYFDTLNMTEKTVYVDAQTMTNESDEKNYIDTHTMIDIPRVRTSTYDIHPGIQAQTAKKNSFDIEQKYPGIVVFEILKIKKVIVFTGLQDQKKTLQQVQLFVINTDNYESQYFDIEKKPYNITSLDDDIVALSYPDRNKVDMINIKTGRQDHSIKVKSLAIFQSNNQLFVITFGKIERITKDGYSIESFNLPTCTHMIDHISVYDERLYYTYHASLYCCGLNGRLFWKFQPKIEKHLSGIATDKYGKIYVSSNDPVNVLVVSHDGKHLRNISYDFRNETKPVKIHCDQQGNCLSILRASTNVVDFFDVRCSE